MAFPYEEEDRTRRLPGNRLPAQQVPLYTPEQPPRIAGPSPAPQLTGPGSAARLAAPPTGPLSSAAGMAGRIFGGTASLLSGGMTATKKAADTVSAAPEYFASSIGDDGLAANILMASRATPERVEAPEVEERPMISRPSANQSGGASGDWDRSGLMNTSMASQMPETPSIARGGASGDWETAQSPAFPTLAGNAGKSGNPASPGFPAPQNSPSIAAMPEETASNPFNEGVVQIIRPGSQISYAVQGDYGMTEFDPTAFEQYRTAFDKNPQALSRMKISESGPVIDGSVMPAAAIAGNSIDELLDNQAKNRASGFSQKTVEDIAVARASARPTALDTAQGPMSVLGGVATPVLGPDGKPLGPKLKEMPAEARKALFENNAALRKVVDAEIAIREAPSSLGLENYLPDSWMQRIDPAGVKPRALVADIGSLKIHDRSGAAVSASETPRLKPFIPAATDSDQVALQKIELFFKEYASMQNDIATAYSPEQGYKPMPADVMAVPKRPEVDAKGKLVKPGTAPATQPAQPATQPAPRRSPAELKAEMERRGIQ